MGKNKSSKRRESTDFANRRLPDEKKPYRLSQYDSARQQSFPFSDLREIQDLRTFHPEITPLQPAKVVTSTRRNLARTRSGQNEDVLAALESAVDVPISVMDDDRREHARRDLICARRQMRREVLHALKRTGKGGRGKRTWKSKVSC